MSTKTITLTLTVPQYLQLQSIVQRTQQVEENTTSRVSDEAIRQQLTYWRDRANRRPDEFAEQLVACSVELQARNADAARYRWLCKPCTSNRMPHVTQYPPAQFDGDKYYAVQIDKHGMDSAIDAAMRIAP